MQIHILLELMILGCWDNTSSLCNSKKFEEEEAVKYGRSIKVLTRYAHWTVNVPKQNYVSIEVVTYFLPWWCHGHQNNFSWNLCCYKCFWLTNVERQTLAVSEFLKVKGQIGKRCIQPDLAFLQIAQAYQILCTSNHDGDSTFEMATFSSAEKQWLLKFATAKTTGMSGCD